MEQLRTLSGLLQEPNKMGDAPPAAPRSQRGKGATVLEETDDEEDEAEPDREEDMDLEEDGPADGRSYGESSAEAHGNRGDFSKRQKAPRPGCHPKQEKLRALGPEKARLRCTRSCKAA